MSAALHKHINRDRVRSLRVAIYTCTSCNTFLIAASFAFSISSFSSTADLLILIPQICVFFSTIVYCFFIAKYNNPKLQVVFALLIAATYLYFAVSVFIKLVAGANNVLFLFWIVESVNVIIAALVLTEAMFSWLVRNDPPTQSGNDDEQQRQHGQGGTDPTVPQAVHIYQPRLSLPPPHSPRGSNGAGSIHSARRHSAQASSTDGAVDEDDLWLEDDLELEELPKYQRRRPAQSATIIDLSNLASIDATVLDTVIHGSDARLTPPTQTSPDLVHDIVIGGPLEDDTTAPEYSPPLSPSRVAGSIPEVVIDFAAEEGDQVSPTETEGAAHDTISTPFTTTATATVTATTSTAATIPPPQTTEQSSTGPEPPVYMP